MTGDEKRELAVYSEAYRDGHSEGFGKGWSDGFGAGQHAYRQSVLAAFGDDEELPSKLEALLRATE